MDSFEMLFCIGGRHRLVGACDDDAWECLTFRYKLVGDGIGSSHLEPAFDGVVYTRYQVDEMFHLICAGREVASLLAVEVVAHTAVGDVSHGGKTIGVVWVVANAVFETLVG